MIDARFVLALIWDFILEPTPDSSGSLLPKKSWFYRFETATRGSSFQVVENRIFSRKLQRIAGSGTN